MTSSLLPGEKPLQQTLIGRVDSFEDAQDFMRWLGESRGRTILAVDTETSGLNPWAYDARVRLAQFGDENSAWVINAEKYPGLVQEVLETYRDTEFAFHNVGFDAKYMQVVWPNFVFPWRHIHDTMLMCRINDNEASAGLKPVSERLFGRIATAGQKALEEAMSTNKWTWATVPMDLPAYNTYSALDVILTARLFRRLGHIHSGQFKAVYDLEREARRICTGMEIRGMRIDVDYCATKKRELDQFIERSKAYCLEKYGVEIGSTMQLGRWFEARGVELPARTATGLPKMGADELKAISIMYPETIHPEVNELASYAIKSRKADKISGTYLRNFLNDVDANNIVHATINTIEARTSRMSVTDPALQTLPREDKTVRPSVVPHEGQVLLTSDLDQLELRLIANLSGDQQMASSFKIADTTGPDFFTSSAREVHSDPTITKADRRRQTCKNFWYSTAYGAGIRKQALTAGVPYEEMAHVAKRIQESYPVFDAFKSTVSGNAAKMAASGERPYVTTALGRRLYVPADKPYAAVNYLIQSTAADEFKQNLIDLDNSGLGDAMLMPVHDEIVLSVDPNLVHDLKPIINDCMSNFQYNVPLTADCSKPMDRWVKS
jgi:DNA polymerase-1